MMKTQAVWRYARAGIVEATGVRIPKVLTILRSQRGVAIWPLLCTS